MILIDTSIWSIAFRRQKPGEEFPQEVEALKSLIKGDETIALPGVVLQELLSGLKEEAQFNRLRRLIEGFPVLLATDDDHIKAAQISNICRRKGIATTAVDCLITAMTIERGAQLFTIDQDFTYIAELCPLQLYQTPEE